MSCRNNTETALIPIIWRRKRAVNNQSAADSCHSCMNAAVTAVKSSSRRSVAQR